jgi:hypothetical protein
MTSSEFAYICKHPEIIAAQYIQPLEETAKRFPFCQSSHILTAKFYEDIDEHSAIAKEKLQRAAVYCSDRAMLKSIIDRDPANVIQSRQTKENAQEKNSTTKNKTGRSKKIETSVIYTDANQMAASKSVAEKPKPKSFGLDVRVPEIILPNERLIPFEKSQPFEHNELHISKSKLAEKAGFIPVVVNQPVGDKLFSELYENLRELRQRKKKVMIALEKLSKPTVKEVAIPVSKPQEVLEKTNVEVPAKVVETPAKQVEPEKPKAVAKTKAAPKVVQEIEVKPIEPKAKTKPQNKETPKEVLVPKTEKEKKPTTPKVVKTKPTDKAPQKPVKVTLKPKVEELGVEHESEDETDLLLAYLSSLKHEEAPPEPKVRKKAADQVSALDSQHHLIDQFLKELPNIKTRDVRHANPQVYEGDLSESSTTEAHLVSENLARIYLRQGNKEKARETFSKLILKYPEKRDYFAAEIKKLEE